MLSDYQKFLEEKGLSEDVMDSTRKSLSVPDKTDSEDNLYIGDSDIHGKGMFASKQIEKGSHIAPLVTDYGWTATGMLINHSITPNAIQIGQGITALRRIDKDEEVTMNYRDVFPLESRVKL